MKRFPRVLFVTKSQVNDVDGAGAALRGWFKEWPRDHLAQIYSGVPAVGNAFCLHGFWLGPKERRLGSMFFKLKGSPLGDAALPYRRPSPSASLVSKATRAGGRFLVESGVWELVFAPKLSPRLESFIQGFRPEVMFVQGCDISFMRLPLLIRSAFGTPIHFDIVDDWVEHLYGSGVAGPLMKGVVRRTFRELLQASAGRYTIGEAMADVYRERYGVTFTPLMQCDDPERFARAGAPAPRRETFEIVYSGSLALGRWRPLLELADACVSIRSRVGPISITAYVPFVPNEAAEALRAAPALSIRPAVPDAQVPAMLAGADLLFLPESFDPAISEYIKLSVSTKAHLYMMAGRPTLVYGPAGIGTVEYARRYGWGHVVDRPGVAGLREALEVLMTSAVRRDELVRAANAVASTNHAGRVIREKLLQSLMSTCA